MARNIVKFVLHHNLGFANCSSIVFSAARPGLIKRKICIRPANDRHSSFKLFSTSTCKLDMFNVQDEEDFQEKVIKSNVPVIVDFHANWCGPCKILGPRLESIIGEKGGKVHLAKIDIDAVSDLALEYGVSAVPSVLGIKNGVVVDKFVGLQEETRINAFVNKLIGE